MNYPPLAGPDFPRFAPLISDFGFKATFGNEATGEFLRRALQALIKSEVPIREVRLLPTEQTRLTTDSRGGIYDLACTDAEGTIYLIEMQLGAYPEFLQRMKFYALYRLNTFVRRGDYAFEHLPRVYCIGILGTKIFPQVPHYHNLAVLRNEDGVVLDEQLTFVTVELGKFDKPAAACVTDLDKLLFTMQNAHKIIDLAAFPTFWDESWIKVALEEVDTRSMSPEALLAYEMQLSANALAVKHARQDRERNIAEGREEGREQAQLAAPQRALQSNKLSVAEIAELLDMPLAVVQAEAARLTPPPQ